MKTQHGIYCSMVVPEEYLTPPDGGRRYRVSKRLDGKTFECLIQRYCSKQTSVWGMCRHFALCHPFNKVVPKGEVFCSKCENCGMQTTPREWLIGRTGSAICREMVERR